MSVNRAAVALACLIAIAAPIVAVTLASGGEAPAPKPVTGGLLTVRPPAAWTAGAADGRATLRRGGAEIVVGRVEHPSDQAGGLPKDYNHPQHSEQVRLGPLLAMRYDVAGSRLYIVPTDKGDQGITCVRPTAACDVLAATATLRGARALAPGPDPAVVERLRNAMANLEAARERAAAGLMAPALAERADTARTLAAAHRTAARALSSNQDDFGTGKALDDAAHALDDLAAAAGAGNRRGYARASAALTTAETELDGALDGLQQLGYPVTM